MEIRSAAILYLLSPGTHIEIGPDTGLSGAVICSARRIEIGARCLIGADVMIFDGDFHNSASENRRYAMPDWPTISKEVLIGDDVFVGAHALICKGARIGSGSIVAAGSVFTHDIPAYSVAAAVPAKVIGKTPK